MTNRFRAANRQLENRGAQVVAATAAPPVKPPAAPARPKPEAPRNVPPRRAGDGEQPGKHPLPPVQRPAARFSPLALFLAQTVIDMMAIGSAFVLSYWVRFESDIFKKYVEPDAATYVTMFVVTVATIITTFYFSKLYNLRRGASRVDEFYKIAGAVSMGTVLSLATNSLILGDKFVYSRQILLMGWFLSIMFVTVGRLLFSFALGALRKRGLDRSPVVVVGTGPTAAMVIDRLRSHRSLGYDVVGAIDANGGKTVGNTIRKVPVLGSVEDLRSLVRRLKVSEVIVALSGASERDIRDVLERLQDQTVSIKVYPDAFQLMTENEVSVGELSGLPLLSVKDVALRGWNRILKRAFDVVFSLCILVLISPVMLIIAVAIKLTSPGPVFFIQERVGLDNKPFQLVKFRTMRVMDEKSEEASEDHNRDWTVQNDPRRTSLGAFLRRFSLDELPQFYNVLIGEMSVVGPRPEQPQYVQAFAERLGAEYYLRRHKEKAGLTGWAQVNGLRGDTSIQLRTSADLYYVENWSILFDLKIIVRTIFSMVMGKNAY